jgi:hypothetical protein
LLTQEYFYSCPQCPAQSFCRFCVLIKAKKLRT